MTIEEKILKLILAKLLLPKSITFQPFLTKPVDRKMGDLSLPCFELAKVLKKSPVEISIFLQDKLNKSQNVPWQKVEAVAGYLNFTLKDKYFSTGLEKIIKKGQDWGKNNFLQGKLFLAEHTDPNLFKEFHIGHLMTNTIGESLGRLAGFCGATVKQVTFQGDVGLHVAKTLYGMKNHFKKMPRECDSIWLKQKFLGECYAWGNKQYEKNNIAKKEIIQINKNIYSQKNVKQNKLYQKGKKWSLEYFDKIYKIIGSKFNYYFLESETAEIGKKLVEENIDNIFKKSQGAIIFPGSKYGLHDRVFINSKGLPTYEAKDLGLFFKKWQKYNPDISLTITGDEQKQYFEVVKKVAGMINKEWADKTIHLAHGTLRLKSGKMSSRQGDIIRAKQWIDDTTINILAKMQNKNKVVAQKIALAAIKYSILKVQSGKNIIYDQKKALSFVGDSGPYLQYTYVRIQSIWRKLDKKDKNLIKQPLKIFDQIYPLNKILLEFPTIILKSFKNNSAHYLADYLHTLASEFNSFYAHIKILDKKNPKFQYHLMLSKATAQTISNGLYLLGIQTVDKM